MRYKYTLQLNPHWPKKDVSFYIKNLTKQAMKKIDLCLKLIRFGTSSTVLNFQEKYYKYGG